MNKETYAYTIYTRDSKSQSWDCMLGGFGSSHEALTWLISTYEASADFWIGIDVRIIREMNQ